MKSVDPGAFAIWYDHENKCKIYRQQRCQKRHDFLGKLSRQKMDLPYNTTRKRGPKTHFPFDIGDHCNMTMFTSVKCHLQLS